MRLLSLGKTSHIHNTGQERRGSTYPNTERGCCRVQFMNNRIFPARRKATAAALLASALLALSAPAMASSLDELSSEMEENKSEQEEAEKSIEEYEAEIAELAEEINSLEEEIDYEYEIMKLRIQAFYENFNGSVVESIISEGTVAGLITDIESSIELVQYDRDKLDEIAAMVQELEEKEEKMLALLDEAYLEREQLEAEYEVLETEYNELLSASGDLDLMAAIIYCEAGGEEYEGQMAVGCVIMNRISSSSYPDTLSGVIYQKGQFSPASSGRLAAVLANDIATASCYKAAEYVLSGNNPYPDWLFFSSASVTPRSDSYTTIGNQNFW